MRITGIRTGTINIPLKKTFITALRSLDILRSVIVAVDTDTGDVGWGEAVPSVMVTGETLAGIKEAIHEYIAPNLKGLEVEALEEVLEALNLSCKSNNSAKAAVDMAVYDLFGKLYKIPLFRLLGGKKNFVETDITISKNSPDEMVEDAKDAIESGFRILKIKVGKEPDLDFARIKAIRHAIGNEAQIRVDANQGWSIRDTIRIMSYVEGSHINIEILEQPVVAHDIEGLRIIREAIRTPIMADESLFTAFDAERLIEANAVDMFNIKLMKTGGIREALRICTIAELHSVPCFMGCMLESRIAITAAVHLACARSIIMAYDLDAPYLCAADPVIGGVEVQGARLIPTSLPGLGIEKVEGVIWD